MSLRIRPSACLAALALTSLAAFAGCSAADTASCTSSDECERGSACTPSGTCGEVPCSDGCIDGVEGCLLADDDGEYDANADGVCSALECTEGSRGGGCESGEECIDGICYPEGGGGGGGDDGTCRCNTDCAAGQGCTAGVCGAPPATCASDCECAVGLLCEAGTCVAPADPCEGITCDDPQTCVDGVCVDPTACDPPCGADEMCDEASGACVPVGGNLCDTCTSDDDCGGPNDGCVTLGDGQVCGSACTTVDDCPDGFTCFRVDSVIGQQCVPQSGACTGCLVSGCDEGQFCNPVSEACEPQANTCQPCAVPNQCGPDAECVEFGGAKYCVDDCSAGQACDTGYACQTVRDVTVCMPETGSCGGGVECDITEADCTSSAPIFDPFNCLCIECEDASDCGANQLCTDSGECVNNGDPCASLTDCPAGQICDTRVDVCVECITSGDCPSGEICVAGACQACECPTGFRCNLEGECVEVTTPGGCTTDADCVLQAIELGGDYSNAACDPVVGCYTRGVCNGDLLGGGGLPLPLPVDFGGTTDPFNASCSASTTCTPQFGFEGLISGSPDFFEFACGPCNPSDPNACRQGEVCQGPDGLAAIALEILGIATDPVCKAP